MEQLLDRHLSQHTRHLPVLLVLGAGLILLVLAILMPAITRPYGESDLLAAIDRDDSTQCERWGYQGGASEYTNCKLDLLALRRRHEDLLAAYFWR